MALLAFLMQPHAMRRMLLDMNQQGQLAAAFVSPGLNVHIRETRMWLLGFFSWMTVVTSAHADIASCPTMCSRCLAMSGPLEIMNASAFVAQTLCLLLLLKMLTVQLLKGFVKPLFLHVGMGSNRYMFGHTHHCPRRMH